MSPLDSIQLKGGITKMKDETQDSTESSAMSSSKPVFKAKVGAYSAAVFLKEVDGRQLPSIAVERSFKIDGEWKHQKISLLNASEADKLITVLQDVKKALYTGAF